MRNPILNTMCIQPQFTYSECIVRRLIIIIGVCAVIAKIVYMWAKLLYTLHSAVRLYSTQLIVLREEEKNVFHKAALSTTVCLNIYRFRTSIARHRLRITYKCTVVYSTQFVCLSGSQKSNKKNFSLFIYLYIITLFYLCRRCTMTRTQVKIAMLESWADETVGIIFIILSL